MGCVHEGAGRQKHIQEGLLQPATTVRCRSGASRHRSRSIAHRRTASLLKKEKKESRSRSGSPPDRLLQHVAIDGLFQHKVLRQLLVHLRNACGNKQGSVAAVRQQGQACCRPASWQLSLPPNLKPGANCQTYLCIATSVQQCSCVTATRSCNAFHPHPPPPRAPPAPAAASPSPLAGWLAQAPLQGAGSSRVTPGAVAMPGKCDHPDA